MLRVEDDQQPIKLLMTLMMLTSLLHPGTGHQHVICCSAQLSTPG
jgi:hypothetical protein